MTMTMHGTGEHPEVPMGKHYRAMKHIKPAVVAETKTLIKQRLWTKSADEQLTALRHWSDVVSEAYDMQTPEVVFDPRVADIGGAYIPDENVIVLPYFTVMTLLHEFRHAMQKQGANGARSATHENDAVEWSQSLFYKAAPRRFRRMAREGRIMYCSPEEFGPAPTESDDSAVPGMVVEDEDGAPLAPEMQAEAIDAEVLADHEEEDVS